MRIVLRGLLLIVAAAAISGNVIAQPPLGSQLAPEDNACATCHGEVDLWEDDTLRLYISQESLADDIHLQKGVNCHDCHGGDPSSFDVPQAHAIEVDASQSDATPFKAELSDIRKSCGTCHDQQQQDMLGGVHHKGAETPLDCDACHGEKVHGMVAVEDSRSPVFLNNQVKVCGECHESGLDSYNASVHGLGLHESGLLVTAVCSDCHGAHGIYPASDEQSALHVTKVSTTCGTCHQFIEERLAKSVHGRGNGPGGETEEAAPGGDVKRKPSCTDCHQGHDLTPSELVDFRRGLSDRCGSCHADLSSGYAISMHGSLTELGYGPAAMCSDCHGAHDILPISDPDSKLSLANRQATCAECHPGAPRNYISFDPHADHRYFGRNPLLFCIFVVLVIMICSTFGFFGLHSLLWFIRGTIDVFKNGRPKPLKPGTMAYVRFAPVHRVAHTLMVVSFLGLAATGLPLKYSNYQWAQTLAYLVGGFESTSVWHRIFGVMNIGILVVYVSWMLLRMATRSKTGISRIGLVFGPDSMVPNWRDLKDFVQMIRWFFGRGPKPTFERWTYWEKYDFWGASADIVAIGFTGMILWFPRLFCAYLPGEVLNIAKVIHSTQALMATGFVFAIHFFNTHLRPDKMPMDMSILTGLISEEDAHEERADFIQRMRREGQLDQLKTTVPSRSALILRKLGGWTALTMGLALLLGILLAVLGV